MAGESRLMRAGSWQPQGDPMLLKTTSDLLLHVQALQQTKVAHRLSEDAGKTNSVDSSSTAAGQSAGAHTLLHDSATASLLPPLRQISLDIIAASELNRAKGLSASLERSSIFNDVFNELAGKDELAPLQAGQLYTLPSMQFLDVMFSDMDATKSGSNVPGAACGGGSGGMGGGMGSGGMGSSGMGGGMGGPLDLPGDVFDLPSDYPAAMAHAHGQQQQQQQHMSMQVVAAAQQAAMAAAQQAAMAASLRPTPFDQQQQMLHQQQQQQQQQYAGAMGGAHIGMVPAGGGGGYAGFVPTGSAPAQLGAMHPGGSSGSSGGSMTLQASMRAQQVMLVNAQQMHAQQMHGQHAQQPTLQYGAAPHIADYGQLDDAATRRHIAMLQQQQAAAMAVQAANAAAVAARPPPGVVGGGVRQPAVPQQPVQQRATPRRASQAYADFEYEEAEVSLQTSKSGRVRKVASFTGVKRKLDIAHPSESRDSRGSVGPDASAGEVGSKGSKASRKPTAGGGKCRKGRRTVCLNCGCHQTPQWRCGPLGPRTLCNACGVRYKKDLPLNCWPIRDGMVLPPGALLPTGFVVPPGITIHTQPAELE